MNEYFQKHVLEPWAKSNSRRQIWLSASILPLLFLWQFREIILNQCTNLTPEELTIISICLILLWLILGLSLSCLSYMYEIKKLKYNPFNNYEFNSIDGIYKHKTSNKWICSSCKVDNKFSELFFIEKYKMKCPKCDKEFENYVNEFFDLIIRKDNSNSIDLRDFREMRSRLKST